MFLAKAIVILGALVVAVAAAVAAQWVDSDRSATDKVAVVGILIVYSGMLFMSFRFAWGV